MNNPSILITGCSSGIGLDVAKALKARGYRVFATARKTADVDALIAQGFESIPLDVNASNSIQVALDHILQRTGGTLDAIFNNAGYLQAGAIEDLTRDMIRAQFETNVFGLIELTQRVIPIMRKQGYGRIIQNSSIVGIIAFPYYGAYSASKFALEGLTNTLRQELRGTPIHVSLINPGPITSQLRNNAYQQYQKTVGKHPSAVYEKAYQHLEQSYFKSSQRSQKVTCSTDAVIKKLIHALESKHPKAHYYVGFPAQCLAFLKRILPDRALDAMLAKIR